MYEESKKQILTQLASTAEVPMRDAKLWLPGLLFNSTQILVSLVETLGIAGQYENH